MLHLSPFRFFARHISLRDKISAIAGSAVISMIAILSAYLFLSAQIQKDVKREVNIAAHLQILSSARTEITNFTWAINDIAINPSPQKMAAVSTKLEIMAKGATSSKLEPIVRGLAQSLPERGQSVFHRLYQNGLDKDAGNIGALRARVHDIETTLAREKYAGFFIDDLMVDMLMLRRHEKDFMMRKELLYLDRFDRRVTQFRAKLGRSFLADDHIELIGTQLTAYAENFAKYAKGVGRTVAAQALFDKQVAKVMAAIDDRENTLTDQRNETALLISHQRTVLAKTQLALVFFGGLLSVTMALMIGRSIERPITRLGQIMRTLSNGKLDTDVVGTERYDVIGEMARAVEVFKQNAISLRQLLANAEIMANLDELTGLPNRRKYYSELDLLLNQARETNSHLAVLSIDLNGFKMVNDVYGHAVGDALLKQVGNRLRRICKDRCFVGRLGGDEFSMIVSQNCDTDAMVRLGERIQKEIGKTYDISGTPVKISTSIGIAFFPEAGATSDDICERADYALYKCKNSTEQKVVLFSKELESEITKLGAIEIALQNCNFDQEMSMEFQPQYDLRAKRIVGFEALARWNNPALGRVRPDLFIAAAERIGIIEELTDVLFGKALDAAREWPENVDLSFNLSTRDLNSKSAVAQIVQRLGQSGVSASRVVFEITETALMTDFNIASRSIQTLWALGAKIALDDFGTGYSSFGYINQLPIDKIKIDKSFVDHLDSSERSHKLVKTIIDMAKNLQFGCVIEGVETIEQLKIIEKLGGNIIQGYIFGRPMPASDVATILLDQARDTVIPLPLKQA